MEDAEQWEEDRFEGMEYEDFHTDFPGMHEAIQDAVTGAVQEVHKPPSSNIFQPNQWVTLLLICSSSNDICNQQRHRFFSGPFQVMQEAVQEAVQAAVDEGIKFDVRANLYTMAAITGEASMLQL